MQIMANIIGATHIFVYQVRKFNCFSISQKGKGVNNHISPRQKPWNPAFSKDPGPHSERLEQAIDHEHIIWILKERMITVA